MIKVTVTSTYENLTPEGVKNIMDQMRLTPEQKAVVSQGEEIIFQKSAQPDGPGKAVTTIKLEIQS